jgi:hypothetical protein
VSTADVKGPIVDIKNNLLGGDRGNVEGMQNGGGTGPGLGSTSGDTINNLDQMSQSSGPEQRDHQPEIKHGTPGAAATGGQQSNGNDQGSSSAKLVETVALHAVVQLQDAVDKHDGPHQGEPIKPAAEKLGATQIVQDTGHGAHQDAGSGFADLIRAAQNPAQSGIVPPAPAGAHDATSLMHQASLGDLAGHLPDLHGIDNVHAPAAPTPVAMHDGHVDQHAIAAPVLDHISVAHH